MVKIEIIINSNGTYVVNAQKEEKHKSINDYFAKNKVINQKIRDLVGEILKREGEHSK